MQMESTPIASSSLANLPNCLCIDIENGGYDYIDALKVKVNSVKELKELLAYIKKKLDNHNCTCK